MDGVWIAVCWLGVTIGLPVALLLTYKYRRSWFSAATWMQLILAITAAFCLSVVTPALVFSKRILIGGKLAVAFSVFLILATIIQQIDGQRALTRTNRESPLQLSLASMVLLMSVAGIACAWVGTYLFFDKAVFSENTIPSAEPHILE